jgi:hypothetical protein
MSESGSLVNIGELAKPATVLIKKISNAVGAVFEPHQIRRIARAQADAAVIEAEGQIRVTEIQRRAMVRFVQEEGKKQENIEAITSKAIPHLADSSQPDAIDDDWITNFFDKCRIISDVEMQQLWARVLAGEANSPGKYSRRTVNSLASLDKHDAMAFTSLCSCGWVIGEATPLIYNVEDPVYSSVGITFMSLTHLDAIGLIRFESLTSFQRTGFGRRIVALYYGAPVLLEFPNDSENHIDIGHVIFTQIGKQLAPIVASQRSEGFFLYVLEQWTKKGLCPSSPLPIRNIVVDATIGAEFGRKKAAQASVTPET